MYRYDITDKTLVRQRVAQFRDQTQRFLKGALSEDDFRHLRLRNGLYLQRHAPRRTPAPRERAQQISPRSPEEPASRLAMPPDAQLIDRDPADRYSFGEVRVNAYPKSAAADVEQGKAYELWRTLTAPGRIAEHRHP